jgi:hypothetical protein
MKKTYSLTKRIIYPQRLVGASLQEQNNHINEILKLNNIVGTIEFNPAILQTIIDNKKSFSKGLIAYLQKLEKELETLISDNTELKCYILQMFIELGSLVFPNTTACYSIIPKDLKDLNWKEIIDKHNHLLKNIDPIHSKSNKLLLMDYDPKLFGCLVALSISKIMVNSVSKNMNSLLLNNDNKYKDFKSDITESSLDTRPRVKSGAWIGILKRDIQEHFIGLNKPNSDNKENNQFIGQYSEALATLITEELLNRRLLRPLHTISNQSNQKKVNYYVWAGSDLLLYPKTFALPMVIEPNDWVLNSKSKEAQNGGHLLFSLTNLTYQGYLDSRSNQLHKHVLILKRTGTINKLQKIPFCVNHELVQFYIMHQKKLTEEKVLLLTNDWIEPTKELILEVHKKWLGVDGDKTSNPRNGALKELTANKYETLKNQDVLEVTKLFKNKLIYWPVFQDFRGRIYRIGHLNIQLNPYVRSLARFYSKNALTHRKRNASTNKYFNLLLQEVLIKEHLIEKWYDIFGRRDIYYNDFSELLLKDLLAKNLSIIQVGQLLSIREGAYDTVGVFYDASASAYQIMGVLNGDKTLCQLTNVLKSEDGQRQDLYQYVLNDVFKNIDFSDLNFEGKVLAEICIKHFNEKADRSLVKSIVMPLIYGKSSRGFADNLREFFEKDKVFAYDSTLIKIANHIIVHLKTSPLFVKVSVFMKMLRAIGPMLYDLDAFVIKGFYSHTKIAYYKEETQTIFLYYKGDKGYKKQKVSLTRAARDTEGNLIKSKTKAITALIANYIHFLDALICHYAIDNLKDIPVGTIHDSFFIKPKHKEELKEHYKNGLILAYKTHVFNLFNWLLVICTAKHKTNNSFKDLVERLEKIVELNSTFENDITHIVQYIPSEEMLTYCEQIIPGLSHSERVRWHHIIEYFEMKALENGADIVKSLQDSINIGELLFPDNE